MKVKREKFTARRQALTSRIGRLAHDPKHIISSVKDRQRQWDGLGVHGCQWNLDTSVYWWCETGKKQPNEFWGVQRYTVFTNPPKCRQTDWAPISHRRWLLATAVEKWGREWGRWKVLKKNSLFLFFVTYKWRNITGDIKCVAHLLSLQWYSLYIFGHLSHFIVLFSILDNSKSMVSLKSWRIFQKLLFLLIDVPLCRNYSVPST